MKSIISSLTLALLTFTVAFAENTNIDNLITESDWTTLFPNRAGINPGHSQGYTYDFYSYANLRQAADEMSDYLVEFKRKPGVSGEVITVKIKSSGVEYTIRDADAFWYSSSVSEVVTNVDFEKFLNRSDDVNNKRELAAFLANISKETTGGWQPIGSGGSGDLSVWGLHYVHELNTALTYTQDHALYPPNWSKKYYGRGPIQISWNYNYGQFSEFLYNDKMVLIDNPDAIQNDPVLAFKSAIWFWMMPQCPIPSCHMVMHDLWVPGPSDYPAANKMNLKGFAHTNNIINGALECRSGSSLSQNVIDRSELFKYYMGVMGFSAAEVNQENEGEYSTLCYEGSSNTMLAYLECAIEGTEEVSCTRPSLGDDQSICSGSIDLNAGVSLAGDESIRWYKDDVLIPGEVLTTLTVADAGTYKAEILGSDGCLLSDVVAVTLSGTLDVSASNEGIFCTSVGPVNSVISVTGGGGFYNFYETEVDGSPVASGSEFLVDDNLLALGGSQTYYVEESAGSVVSIGDTERDLDLGTNQWYNYDVFEEWKNNRTVFTTHSDVKLQSVDLALGFIGDGIDHNLNVYIYEYGTDVVVASKYFELGAADYYFNGPMNTFSLDFDLPAGQYEMSFLTSDVMLWMNFLEFGDDYGYAGFSEPGIASIDGVNQPSDAAYPSIFSNIHVGIYNWTFSTGGDSDGSCGRTPITIMHDCETGVNDLNVQLFDVYPNPAYDVINISFNDISVEGGVLELYNSVGQLLKTEKIVNVGTITQIQTSNLDGGIYYLKLSVNGNTGTSSVVVTK